MKHPLVVPKTGLEPARLATYAPETYASTNSAIWASLNRLQRYIHFLYIQINAAINIHTNYTPTLCYIRACFLDLSPRYPP